MIEAAANWGKRLGVENYQELVDILRGGNVPEKSPAMENWASLYAIRFFESAGLDVVYDGEQRRVEMYEHLLEFVSGITVLGIVKVWGNNYYRKAAVHGQVGLIKPYHSEEFVFVRDNARKEVKVPVTGPYTLADWSYNEYYTKRRQEVEDPSVKRLEAKRDLVLDVAKKVLRPNVKHLVELGAKRIQFDEPAATSRKEEVELFVEAINAVVTGIDCEFSIHNCYSNYEHLFPYIADAKVKEVVLECANRDGKSLGTDSESRGGYKVVNMFREYAGHLRIGPGVIDVHVDEVESPELVRDRLLYCAQKMGSPESIVACNDCGLRTRSWDVAYSKELSLVEGARLAGQEYG